jgi:hypothetical protein
MNLLRIAAPVGIGLAILSPAFAQDYCDTEVPAVTPGTQSVTGMTPPSDAMLLFNGKDLSQWKGKAGPAEWVVKDGILSVKKGSGDIETQRSFHDIQLHVEWRIPQGITGEGQHRGNSGVFLNGRYEIQILDSYQHRTYADGLAGAIYGQVPPLVNAMRPPGEWNTYEILFTAPRFYDDGKILSPARVTVLHNGVLIQSNAEIAGSTGAWGKPGYHDAEGLGPIRLQDHPGAGEPVSFRNIWVREIGATLTATTTTARTAEESLKIVSTTTIQELIANPAARAVLSRCVPELVPNPAILDYVGKKKLSELKGELDISLSDSKLQIIDEQLAKALAGASNSAPQK